MSEEEETRRRIQTAREGDTGDQMQSESEIETLLVELGVGTGEEWTEKVCTKESGFCALQESLGMRQRPR